MLGRQVLMDSLVSHDVRYVFGNPGTTETPLLDSLADHPRINYIMTLCESVAVTAASFYAQASGSVPLVSLHVAPGLGNGIGSLYGAFKANSPMVVMAGQQDTRMRLSSPLLAHDLVAIASPVTKWSVQIERADEIAPVLRRAFKVATDGPPGPVFVSMPIDVLEQDASVGATAPDKLWRSPAADPAGIEEIASLFLSAKNPVIVAGDDVARAKASDRLVALAEAVGAQVWFEGLRHHASFPTIHPNCRQAVPFDAAQVRGALRDADLVLLLGGPFFEDVWYAPGGHFPSGALIVQIEESAERLALNHRLDAGVVGEMSASLAALVARIGALATPEFNAASERRNKNLAAIHAQEKDAYRLRLEKSWNRKPGAAARVMAELRRGLPDDTVIVDESISSFYDLTRTFDFKGFGDYFGGRGGGIGQGLAGALGIKVAMPDRPVVAVVGDGSSMYSIQSLWTAAHHGLAIIFVILANRQYRVLQHNTDAWRRYFGVQTTHPYQHMDLTTPNLDFVQMAAGMGIEGVRVDDPDAIASAVQSAMAMNRPYLIEVSLEGKL